MMQVDSFYHVYNHANGFENLFQSDENYRFFLEKWSKDWPHSSYHEVISDKLPRIKRKAVQDWFGSKNELKKFHSQAIQGLEKLENKLT